MIFALPLQCIFNAAEGDFDLMIKKGGAAENPPFLFDNDDCFR